jgi:adenylate kinase family enzyme
MSASRHVWYRLVNAATGETYPGTRDTKVFIDSTADVDDFRDAVYLKNSKKLASLNALNLVVYKNSAAYEKRNAAVNEEKQYPLSPTELLGEVGSKEDALIVEVPAPIVNNKRKRVEWEVHKSKLAQLSYNPESTIFKLDTECLAKTGLFPQNLVLYCRPTFHAQFRFLREEVLDKGVLGWILGPPGTGKSTTALAFASTLDRKDWVVTWIRLRRRDYPQCLRLEKDCDKSMEIHDSNIDELFDILGEVDGSKQHIVFLDGYTSKGRKHSDVQQACYSWLEKDPKKRRLVVVCSMSSRYKATDEDPSSKEKEFFVYSWKEQEYLDAVRNDEFFQHVKTSLDADFMSDSPREDLVRSKLYFAGASVRWMFHSATEIVIEKTEESVDSVDDIIAYIEGTRKYRSDNVVNRLFSLSFAQHDMFPKKTSITSRFAAVMLAIKEGPDLVRLLAKATYHDGNPTMDGWMLEMWFFASLCHGGVKLFDNSNEDIQTWPESNVETLDITSFPTLPENNGVWFKPNKWNQGGFDAVFLEKGKGLVTFVQVTGGDTHSFKIECFYDFLMKLSQSSQSFEIKGLEIYFVVDQKESATFKLATPSIPGLLRDFGWESGKEMDKVKVVFIRGWSD